MSNRLFQGVVHQMKDAIDRTIGVVDETSVIISCSELGRIGEVNELVTGPCGVCRQALYEFCGPSLNVIMAKTPDDFIERTLGELLPFGFGPANI